MLVVLQLILQHSALPDKQRTVCRLLCTSKVVNAAVRGHCTGRLPVTFSFFRLQQAKQFAVWLKTHAKLLRSLNIQQAAARSIAGPEALSATDLITEALSATDLIAEALQHAATTHPAGLLLQEVKLQELHCTPELLQQLQRSTQLTSLELQLCQRPIGGITGNNLLLQLLQQPERYQPLVQALAGLTSLRRLNLHSNVPLGRIDHVEVLAPAMSALTRLTALQIAAARPAAVLQVVPQQLQQLHLFPNGSLLEATARLQLGHLTALTLLDSSREISYSQSEPRPFCQLAVRDGDRLPASLQVLTVANVRSALPFEQLRSLRTLVITACSTSAADTRLIASYCRNLQEVQLWYASSAFLDEAAAAWNLLPVTGLHITRSRISADVMQHIASLRDCLQCLDIRSGDVMATAEQTAAALAQLTQLHTLQLQLTYEAGCRVFMAMATSRDFVVSHAIASLPKLTNLLVGCAAPHIPDVENVLGDALLPLCTATQITKLKLVRYGVTNHVLQSLVASLTGLRSLSITYDKCFDGGCLASIADNLHSLERLDLTATSITVDACHELLPVMHISHNLPPTLWII